MLQLLFILHLFIGAVLSGIGIVTVLLAGMTGASPLIAVVFAGFVLAFPLARAIARSMRGE